MAISYDTHSFGEGNAVTSVTFAHATAAGSNLAMAVGVGTQVGSTVNSVTYNAANLTQIANTVKTAPSTLSTTQIWQMVAPATGTNNVVVTIAAADRLFGGAITLQGVDQTTPVNVSGGNTSAGTTVQTSLTTTVDQCFGFDIVGVGSNAVTLTEDAGQTKRDQTSAVTFYSAADSTKAGVSTGVNTMGWTSAVASLSHSVAYFTPAGSAPTYVPGVICPTM